jgi:hypothetical protein
MYEMNLPGEGKNHTLFHSLPTESVACVSRMGKNGFARYMK